MPRLEESMPGAKPKSLATFCSGSYLKKDFMQIQKKNDTSTNAAFILNASYYYLQSFEIKYLEDLRITNIHKLPSFCYVEAGVRMVIITCNLINYKSALR